MKEKILQIIADLEKQRSHIDQAIAALNEVAPNLNAPPAKADTVALIASGKPKKRNMSAEGRERIAAASRKRWAKVKREKARELKRAA